MGASTGAANLTILVLADTHYVRQAKHTIPIPTRRGQLGAELVVRACELARRRADIDAIVMMGDGVDNGAAEGADLDAVELREELARPGLPLIWVRGNHDGHVVDGDGRPVECIVRDYRLIAFADTYAAGDHASRPPEAVAHVVDAARRDPRRPVIALQHNPVHVPIESTYPYILTNREQVMAAYRDAGVVLSISGHYHPGQPLSRDGDVSYLTAPALCEAPFPFVLIELRGREIDVTRLELRMDDQLPLEDLHAHTQLAYCAQDITAALVVERAREMGVCRVCFAEHSSQLYMPPEAFWGGHYLRDPDVCARERRAGRARMPQYRDLATAMRGDSVSFGLEVDGDGAGGITLLDEDRDGWDLLIGAVHYVPETTQPAPDQAIAEREFMAATEDLLRNGVDILAHPFRLFRRSGLEAPSHLLEPVADMLVAYGVAAELNFHTNEPSPHFAALCLERGVKLTFGGDSHAMWEVGAMWPHVRLLQEVGVTPAELSRVLLWLDEAPHRWKTGDSHRFRR